MSKSSTVLEPVCTHGVMTVWRRKPVPPGAKPYVVGRVDDNARLDRQEEAAR